MREAFTRRKRVMIMCLALPWLICFVGGPWSSQNFDLPRSKLWAVAGILFLLGLAYAHFFAFPCPACRKQLGSRTSAWAWSLSPNFTECPRCGLDLDTPLETVETI